MIAIGQHGIGFLHARLDFQHLLEMNHCHHQILFAFLFHQGPSFHVMGFQVVGFHTVQQNPNHTWHLETGGITGSSETITIKERILEHRRSKHGVTRNFIFIVLKHIEEFVTIEAESVETKQIAQVSGANHANFSFRIIWSLIIRIIFSLIILLIAIFRITLKRLFIFQFFVILKLIVIML